MKHGEKVTQIKAYYQEVEKDKLKLVYEDDGIGILNAEKEKNLPRRLRKKHRLRTIPHKKICEVYGWNIQETGKQNRGAQFTITIPEPNCKLH